MTALMRFFFFFYKKMYGRFAGPKKSGRITEVAVRLGSTVQNK